MQMQRFVISQIISPTHYVGDNWPGEAGPSVPHGYSYGRLLNANPFPEKYQSPGIIQLSGSKLFK